MGDSILKKTLSTFSKWPPEMFVNNIIIWLHFLFGFKSRENTPEGHTGTHKSSFFPCKQVGEMVIMNDLE